MTFNKRLSSTRRIESFKRLAMSKEMTEIIAEEYAILAGYDIATTQTLMWKALYQFESTYHKNRKKKQKLKKWLGIY